MFSSISSMATTLVRDVVEEASASLHENLDENEDFDEPRRSRLEAQVAQLEAALGQAMEQNDKLEARALAAKRQSKESDSWKDKATGAVVQMEELRQRAEEYKLGKTKADSELSKMREIIKTKEIEMEDIVNAKNLEIEELRSNLEKHSDEDGPPKPSEAKRFEKEVLKGDINPATQRDIEKLRKELTEANRKEETWFEEKGSLNQKLSSLQQSFDKLQSAARVTFDSESTLESRCSEYEEKLDRLESADLELKRRLSKLETERRHLEDTNLDLEQQLNMAKQELKAAIEQMDSKFDGMERQQKLVKEYEDRISSLEEELNDESGSGQRVHQLTSDIVALRGDLRVALSDVTRLNQERLNLDRVLTNLNEDLLRRTTIFEKKVVNLEQQLEKSHSDSVEMENKHEARESELVQALSLLERQVTVLHDIQSQHPEDSSLLEFLDDQQIGNESSTSISDDDKIVLKKTLVGYFERKSNGSIQSQREMLNLLANLLDLNQDERETVGLLPPKHPLVKRSDSQTSLLRKIIFGEEENSEISDASRKHVDWEAQVNAKPFADLWVDVLSHDL